MLGLREDTAPPAISTVVVNENGEPLVVYRGTHGVRGDPHETRAGTSTWTDVPEIAAVYSDTKDGHPQVHAAYLIMQNPITFAMDGEPVIGIDELQSLVPNDSVLEQIYDELYIEADETGELKFEGDGGPQDYLPSYELADCAAFLEYARSAGYDGMIYYGSYSERVDRPENTSWDAVADSSLEYRVFTQEQVVPTAVKLNTAPPKIEISEGEADRYMSIWFHPRKNEWKRLPSGTDHSEVVYYRPELFGLSPEIRDEFEPDDLRLRDMAVKKGWVRVAKFNRRMEIEAPDWKAANAAMSVIIYQNIPAEMFDLAIYKGRLGKPESMSIPRKDVEELVSSL